MAASLRSMKKYLNLVEARVRDAEDILTQMPPGGQGPSPRVLKRLEDAEEALKAQFKRTNDAYADAIVNPDLKQDEDDQIEALMKKAREAKDQTMGKLMKVLDDNQPAVQGLNQGPPAKRSMRIEEVLKPKDPLCESMTLEEVEHWLKGYEAFMDHNKEVLTQEGIKVSRAIFDKCLDPKLSTRLRNIQNENGENMVKDDTPI